MGELSDKRRLKTAFEIRYLADGGVQMRIVQADILGESTTTMAVDMPQTDARRLAYNLLLMAEGGNDGRTE